MSKRPARPKDAPCTRLLAEQCADRTGAARRGDHSAVARIELLSDAQLDELRARFPGAAEDGMDEYDALMGELAERNEEIAGRIAEHAARLPYRPVASIVVCTECGERSYLTAQRAWDVDRAMARLGVSERDILAVLSRLEGPSAVRPSQQGRVLDPRPSGVDLDAYPDDELRALLAAAQAS